MMTSVNILIHISSIDPINHRREHLVSTSTAPLLGSPLAGPVSMWRLMILSATVTMWSPGLGVLCSDQLELG